MKNLLHIENEKVVFSSWNSQSLNLYHWFLEAETADKRRKEKEDHSVEAYESKFKRIQEISGEENLEKLVDKFIEGSITYLTLLIKNKRSLFLL